jgi:hypothetical protein
MAIRSLCQFLNHNSEKISFNCGSIASRQDSNSRWPEI